jgi:membrane protein implicated in regulation of membrane protease activity
MEPISSIILISIGIGLVSLEAILYSFFIVWFGFGFIIIGMINYFYIFSSGFVQIGSASVVAIVLMFLLKQKLIESLKKAEDIKEDFFNEGGIGIVKNGMVFYKGTYFEIISSKEYKENQKVDIEKIEKNKAFLRN